MSRKCKKSYEEVHKKLREELEKAYLKQKAPGERTPEFDLSFLNEEPDAQVEENDADREEVFVPAKKEKKRRFSQFTKVAAVAIIFLLCANIFLLGKNSSESYGDKGILHRLYQGVTGLFTDSEEQTEDSDVEEFITFDRLGDKELEQAKKFLPGLYVPTYMPEGYELEKLTIEKFVFGDYQAEYVYKNNSNRINVLLYYSTDADCTYQWQGDGNLIEMSDRKIFVSKDPVSEGTMISVYTESCSIDISGAISPDELVMIGKKLEK